MKKNFWKTFLIAPLILVACNKDEEIIDEIPAEDFGVAQFSVVDYCPAPGQFINDPSFGFTDFKTAEEARDYAMRRLTDNELVSLGAWGGYIVVKVRKPVVNSGGYDFYIGGNAFNTSNEPGIVWVACDINGNGKADDEWFELRGSDTDIQGYRRNYNITYYRPQPKENVNWTDCDGVTGTVDWIGAFHSQSSYYPSWISADSYTLTGSILPAKTEYNETTGEWSNPPFDRGYADNRGEDSEMISVKGKTLQVNHFRISDAVDGNGNPVTLQSIDFIKVQTAVSGSSGRLGELSTEVCGFFIEH